MTTQELEQALADLLESHKRLQHRLDQLSKRMDRLRLAQLDPPVIDRGYIERNLRAMHSATLRGLKGTPPGNTTNPYQPE